MQIEKIISPFIESQFPQFYQEEGPVFIEFVKAYYEWMEATGNVTNLSRSLLSDRDLDTTLPNYITYFKNKYVNSLPENVLADKKLLIKHILELYRSKGTESSYKLLFKMLFNEDIETYLPSSQIFKPSNGEWVTPTYIEVSDNPHLARMIGNKIYSTSTLSTAVVENYYVKTVNDKVINVLVLSNLFGNIKYGEKILCEALPEITVATAPISFGSLTSVSIVNGGLDYNIGDILTVKYGGAGGLAKVKAVTGKNGEVSFSLIKGGTGFSLDAAVNVDGRVLEIDNIVRGNPLKVYTKEKHKMADATSIRIAYVQGMDDVNVDTYAYFIKSVPDASLPEKYKGKVFELYSDISLSETVNGNSFDLYFAGGYIYVNTGAQQQATFKIGSIVNKQIYNINTDHVRDMSEEQMNITAAGYNVHLNVTDGVFSSGDILYMPNIDVLDAECEVSTDTLINYSIPLNNQQNSAYFANGETLSTLPGDPLSFSNLRVVNIDNNYIQITGSDIYDLKDSLPVTLISDVSKTQLEIKHIYGINTVNCYANAVIAESTVVSANVNIRGSYQHLIYPHIGYPDEDTIIRNGVNSTAHVIRLINANSFFEVGDKVLYSTPDPSGEYAPTTPISAIYDTSNRFTMTSMTNVSDTITVTYAEQELPPYVIDQPVLISDVVPAAYNGAYNVLTCNTTAVTYQGGGVTGAITTLGHIQAHTVLPANSVYYCQFVNSSSIGLSYTNGGPRINIIETRSPPDIGDYVETHTLSKFDGYFINGATIKSIGTVVDNISVASPSRITVPAGSSPANNTPVIFKSYNGLLPTGITSGVTYYAARVDENEFELSKNNFAPVLTSKVNTTDDTINIDNHGFVTGDQLYYFLNGSPAIQTSTGYLTTSVVYYVIKVDNNLIQLATTSQNATNGIAINLTGVGNNNQTFLNMVNVTQINVPINNADPFMNLTYDPINHGYYQRTNTDGSAYYTGIVYTVYYDKATATIGRTDSVTEYGVTKDKKFGVDRLTDWIYFGNALVDGRRKNLDTDIGSILHYIQKEVGTIASLTDINPGKGYSVDPVVSIIEPLIYDLGIVETPETVPGALEYVGTTKGFNASVTAKAVTANGIVTAIEVIDSGFGYGRNQQVSLLSNTNPYAVTGTTVVDRTGIGKGYWKDNKGFLSDEMYLQDSYYYQKYSYEVIAPRMLDTYENYVKKLVHPTGILLFGKFVVYNEMVIESAEEMSFDIDTNFSITADGTIFTADNSTTTYKADHN